MVNKMQDNKKSKKYNIDKLHEILDNISSKDLPPEDEKYLKSLDKRLDEPSKEVAYRKAVFKDISKQDTDSMKPKVTIYPRKEKKVVEFKEVKVDKKEIETKVIPDVEFLPAEEKKEIQYQDEDVIEIEKKEATEPEFLQVIPKKVLKKEKEVEFKERKDVFDEELTEWKPVETEKKQEEEEKIKVDKYCGKCGARLLEKTTICPVCENKNVQEIESIKIDEFKAIKETEPEPEFIPIKPKEKEEKKEQKNEWEPVETKEIIKEESYEIEPYPKEVTPEEEMAEKQFEEVKEETTKEESFEIEPLTKDVTAEEELTKQQMEGVKEEIIKREEKIQAFKHLKSVDEETAVLLFDNGYTTVDSLNYVTYRDLKKIKGIKRKTAKKIKIELEEKLQESIEVKPIPVGETAEKELLEEEIKEETILKEEEEGPSPVELNVISSEWSPKIEEEKEKTEEPEIPRETKIQALKDLKSVDEETAVILYDNGLKSIDDLISVSLKDLIKIKGIKKKVAKKIKKEIEEKSEWELVDLRSNKDEEEYFVEDEEKIKHEEKEMDGKIIKYIPEKTEEEIIFEEKDTEDVPPIKIEKDETFKEIKSIDDKISALLKENGINSIDDLRKLTAKDLTKIRGIKRKIAKQIKKDLMDLSEEPSEEKKLEKPYERGENPFIEESEWESFDEEKVTDSRLEEVKGYMHGKYTLYKKEIVTKSGKKQIIRFFSKAQPEEAEPIELPDGYEVQENKKTGVPFLKKKK